MPIQAIGGSLLHADSHNIFLLACSEFSSPYWMTFKQCQDRGGHIIKGSKSTPVIFWKWIDKKDSGEVNDVGGCQFKKEKDDEGYECEWQKEV